MKISQDVKDILVESISKLEAKVHYIEKRACDYGDDAMDISELADEPASFQKEILIMLKVIIISEK